MSEDKGNTKGRAVPLPPPDKQCVHVGTNKGPDVRCQRWQVNGFDVCQYHGGSTPVSKSVMRLRLLGGFNVAYQTLIDALNPDNGAAWKERITAAIALLDRCGAGPRAILSVESAPRDYSDMTLEQLREEAQKLVNELKASEQAPYIEQFEKMDHVPGAVQ